MLFPKEEDLCQGEYFFISKGGEKTLSKGEYSVRGNNLLRNSYSWYLFMIYKWYLSWLNLISF
jgi:hypothetical protein